MVMAAGCGTAAGPVPHAEPSMAACLLEAAQGMRRHESALARMEDVLQSRRSPDALGPSAGGVFGAFDGHWRGRWGDIPVEHLWWSVDEQTQLVVIRDGTTLKRGINLAHGQRVCGIVLDQGAPRLHEGRRRADGTLEWRTGRRTYLERVRGTAGNRRYEIQETVEGAGKRCAHYREVPAPPLTSRREPRPES